MYMYMYAIISGPSNEEDGDEEAHEREQREPEEEAIHDARQLPPVVQRSPLCDWFA